MNNDLRCQQAKHKFTKLEDEHLQILVNAFGQNSWKAVSALMPGRTPRQLRERWRYYLSGDYHEDKWTFEEENRLMNLYQNFGSKWSVIAKHMKGKTHISVKNRYHKLMRKKARDEKQQTFFKQNDENVDNRMNRYMMIPLPLPISELMSLA